MNDKIIKQYIDNEFENEFLDFKIKPYEWSNSDSKSDFLSDVICMANSSNNGDKFIILGVKVKSNGERILNGIDKNKLMDSADYQQLVSENIEPSISIEVKIISHQNKDYGIIRIFNCNNRPYLLRKKFNNLEQGYMKVRKGSRNTNINRYILDEIYTSKTPKLESKFKIRGICNGELNDNVMLKKYDFLPDMSLYYKEIDDRFEQINILNIDDVEIEKTDQNDNISEFQKNISKLANSLKMPTEKVQCPQNLIKNLTDFAENANIKLNDNFFNIGNLSKSFDGFNLGGIGNMYPTYSFDGSIKSKKKYKMLCELDEMIEKAYSWFEFEEKTSDFRYVELAISEIGNMSDEDIEVNIELPAKNYVDYDKFPEANSNIIDEINKHYSKKMFKPYYNSDISEFRKKPLTSFNTPPMGDPLISSSTEYIKGLYDYIDYDVSYNEDKAILSFTIRNIKENESMVFPGKIIINGKVKEVEYSIISKNNNKKITGKLEILDK